MLSIARPKLAPVLFSLFSLLFVTYAVAVPSASAFTISPKQLNLAAGESTTLIVRVTNTQVNGVALNLKLTNLKVESVTLPVGLLSINTCEGGTAFTDNAVCVDIAQKQKFTQDEVVAEIKVTKQGGGAASVEAVEGSKYSDNTKVTGNLAVEETASSSNDLFIILLGGALSLIAVFVVTYMLAKSRTHKSAGGANIPTNASGMTNPAPVQNN